MKRSLSGVRSASPTRDSSGPVFGNVTRANSLLTIEKERPRPFELRLVDEDLRRTASCETNSPGPSRVRLSVAALDSVRPQHPTNNVSLHLVVDDDQGNC